MQRTQNYNLCQWAAEDRILRSDFNDDNAKIDAGVAAAGAKFAGGTYVGTGTYSEENPVRLQFSFEPKLILLTNCGGADRYSDGFAVLIQGQTTAFLLLANGSDMNSTMFWKLYVTWNGTEVSWYNANNESTSMNHNGYTYNYIAIG